MQRCDQGNRGAEESAGRRPSVMRWAFLSMPVAIPLILSIAPAFIGLDFGSHWDEPRHLYSLHRSVDTGILLPGRYIYPSVCYSINMALLTPEFATALFGDVDKDARGAFVNAAIASHQYLMRARGTYVVLCALSILWVYWTLLLWRGHWLWAFVGASALALSWEVNYHMRYVAADALMMQFAALTLLLALLAVRQKERASWLYLAAAAAGAATATKYPAGLLVVLVLVAAAIRWERASGFPDLVRTCAAACAVFFATYLLITPGSVLEPFLFFREVVFHIQYYAQGHASHNVAPGIGHLLGILQYVGVCLFSRYDVAGLALSCIAVVGIAALVRDSRKLAVLVLCVPLLYALYFSRQRVLIARNLLVMAPFAAVLIGLGFEFLWKSLRIRPAQWGLAGIVAALFALNAWWLFYAAGTIQDRGSDRFVREAGAYMAGRADSAFYLTESVSAELARANAEKPARIASDSGEADAVVFFAREVFPDATGDNWKVDCHGNFFWTIARVFGPQEVNWLLYTKWPANERIIIMTAERAARLGLHIP